MLYTKYLKAKKLQKTQKRFKKIEAFNLKEVFINYKKYRQCKNGYLHDHSTLEPIHRQVFESKIGIIKKNWHIHHINFDKMDNRIENLISLPGDFHLKLHDRMEAIKRVFNLQEIKEFLKETYIMKHEKRVAAMKELKEFETTHNDIIKKYIILRQQVGQKTNFEMKNEVEEYLDLLEKKEHNKIDNNFLIKQSYEKIKTVLRKPLPRFHKSE